MAEIQNRGRVTVVVTSIVAPILALVNGPIFSIIDKLIPDPTLKAKLKAQISSETIKAQSGFEQNQKEVILQEIARGSRLSKSWRPVLMYLIMVLLLVYGLVLPVIDLFVEKPVVFKPRWHEIPNGLWNLLSLGIGGYIGGRSMEKIATAVSQTTNINGRKNGQNWRRRNNLHQK